MMAELSQIHFAQEAAKKFKVCPLKCELGEFYVIVISRERWERIKESATEMLILDKNREMLSRIVNIKNLLPGQPQVEYPFKKAVAVLWDPIIMVEENA